MALKYDAHVLRTQFETIRVIMSDPIKIAEKASKHWPGASCGTGIGNVVLPQEQWSLKRSDKHSLHGSFRIPVGGANPGPSNDDKPKADDNEVVFLDSTAPELYDTLVDDMQLTAGVLHLTASDGELAFACARKKVPYVGICFTEAHREQIRRRLIAKLLDAKGTEGDQDYDAGYALALVGKKVARKHTKPPTTRAGANQAEDDGANDKEEPYEDDDKEEPYNN